jgi:hypothetical protein
LHFSAARKWFCRSSNNKRVGKFVLIPIPNQALPLLALRQAQGRLKADSQSW